MDCLIFYTDGLLEAVQETESKGAAASDAPGKEFFGKNRLEEALTRRQVHNKRAGEAVDLILAAAQDQGFTIEDDITIQVYRHV
jgi:serine phosphatase RsbU (regulator of sigma subunit)